MILDCRFLYADNCLVGRVRNIRGYYATGLILMLDAQNLHLDTLFFQFSVVFLDWFSILGCFGNGGLICTKVEHISNFNIANRFLHLFYLRKTLVAAPEFDLKRGVDFVVQLVLAIFLLKIWLKNESRAKREKKRGNLASGHKKP